MRRQTLELARPLTPEDMMVQSSPEASPAKWHLAHTAWFFESFVLREFLPGYRIFNAEFAWLFNSYYQSFAAFPEKRLRASFSRPGIDEILRFREHVDAGIEQLFETGAPDEALKRIELGANHEEQHQELLLTDILHAFSTNPLRPVYRDSPDFKDALAAGNCPIDVPGFAAYPGGLREAGHAGNGFSFDNEMPRHKVWLEPYSFGTRLVTCGEFLNFIADEGYKRPELWLSAGWDAVQANGWSAPLYWVKHEGKWSQFTLRGARAITLDDASPVSHVSFFEADAYARWAGLRLPTEFEW
ncbi:MAG: ergothioneine biosynthesis protein EgtB, partial [Terracidiphilus sp.]